MRKLRVRSMDAIKQTYPAPRWSFQIFHSKMPMSFDQYDHCGFNCLYCFSFNQKALKCVNPIFCNQYGGKSYQSVLPCCVNLDLIKSIFVDKNPKHQFHRYVVNKYPLQWGCLSDPFCPFERKYGVGLEVLKILDEVQYPISFSTKGTWWVYDDRYMNLFKKNKDIWRVQFSVTTNDDEISKKIEIGASTTAERIDAMRYYYIQTKKSTTLRLRPFIIGITDSKDGHIELINRAAKTGKCFRVSTEFFCMETRFAPGLLDRFKKIGEVAGMDLVEFYRDNSVIKSGYLKLNPDIKMKYVKEMSECCKKNNLLFYVSDAMLKDRSHDFSCSETPDGKWKSNHYPGQFSDAIQIAMKSSDSTVEWKDIKPSVEDCLGGFLWRHATNYNTGGSAHRAKLYKYTMADYIRYLWNTPNDAHSPYKYFYGILRPTGYDDEKNVIYKYFGSGE